MKRRRVILIAAACLAAVVAFLVWPGEREPEYQGKKLSEWLNEYDTPRPRQFASYSAAMDDREYRQLVREALRQIGTNAVPCLVKWVSSPSPQLKPRIYLYFRKLPAGLRIGALERYLAASKKDRATLAVIGFQALGLRAKPAIPELARLARDGSRPQLARRAMRCIALIGDEGVDEVSQLMGDPVPAIRASATNIIQAFAPWRLSGDEEKQVWRLRNAGRSNQF